MKNRRRQDLITIKAVHPDTLQENVAAKGMLACFYAMEMSEALGWSVEERYMQLRHAQIMIECRRSRMLVAYHLDKEPCGMIVTTKTGKPKIRRLEAIFVAGAFRQRGIASNLFDEAGAGNFDWHSFAVPGAVDWHLRRGFRNLGVRPEDGTVEMFTGDYKPQYEFDFALPLQTVADRHTIQQLQRLEDAHKRKGI